MVARELVEGLSEAALLELKTRLGPSPDNYDPDLTVDIAEPLASFQDALMRLKLPGDLMDKAVQKAHETMWKIAEQRSADNMALGDDTRDWEQVTWQDLQSLRTHAKLWFWIPKDPNPIALHSPKMAGPACSQNRSCGEAAACWPLGMWGPASWSSAGST